MKKILRKMALVVVCIAEFIAVWIWASPKSVACNHEITCERVVQEASCIEDGLTKNICGFCEITVSENPILATGHDFSEFSVIVKPSANKNGIKSRTCSICNQEEVREVVCTHDKTYESVIQEATCVQKGIVHNICTECNTVVSEKNIEETKCTYGKWNYTKYATPMQQGKRYKKCTVCGNTVTENYSFQMAGKNSIYIEGTDINACFNISSFTQSAVNRYDIVYTTDNGANDPFVLGHNYGTLGKLYQAKVGSYIYLSVNGKIEKYKIVISESATQNPEETDIIGNYSGKSIHYNYGKKTLHLYTCYGKSKSSRWMVLAIKE